MGNHGDEKGIAWCGEEENMRVRFCDKGNRTSAEVSAAIGVVSAIMLQRRVLLVNEYSAGEGLEAGFNVKSTAMIESDVISSMADFGMDAVLRLSSTQQLHIDNLADYTFPVIQGQLDLVSGRTDSIIDPHSVDQFKSSLNEVYNLADRRYDMVISNSSSCFRYDSVSTLVDHNNQELQVMVVNQNRVELDTVLGYEAYIGFPIVIYHYDPHSKWNISNIRRRYDCNNPIYGIPYSTGFIDAWNNRDIARYLRRKSLLSHRRLQRDSLLSGLLQLSEGLVGMMSVPLSESMTNNYKGA